MFMTLCQLATFTHSPIQISLLEISRAPLLSIGSLVRKMVLIINHEG